MSGPTEDDGSYADYERRVLAENSGRTFSLDDMISLWQYATAVGGDRGAGGGSLAEWLEGRKYR